jgi:hypothetical protein
MRSKVAADGGEACEGGEFARQDTGNFGVEVLVKSEPNR